MKAVSANPAQPIVREVDAQWARDVVAHCVATLLVQAERHIADNEVERNHKRVLDLIRSSGEFGITKTELTRRTQFLDKRHRDEVISTLIEGSMVVESIRVSPTKRTAVYRVVERS